MQLLRHSQGFLLSPPSAEVFPRGCPHATCCPGAGGIGGGGGRTRLGPPLSSVQWDGDDGSWQHHGTEGAVLASAGMCTARSRRALQRGPSAFPSTLCWVCVQEQGSAWGLAGALARCPLLGTRHVLGMVPSGLRWAGGLTRCCLRSTVPGQADAGELAAAVALPPAQEAAGDALHRLVLVARCFLRCGDCYVPATPLSNSCSPCRHSTLLE